MKSKTTAQIFTVTTIGLALSLGSISSANAALVGTQTATVNFQGAPTAVYGHANESGGTFNGNCTFNNCFVQNGIVTGVVADPTDSGAHYHRAGTSLDRELQYHPDSTGLYVRLADLTNFSLQSININTLNGLPGGNFILYGYANAINNSLLTAGGAVPIGSGGYGSSSDEDGGNQIIPGVDRYIASYVIPNNGFNNTINFSSLVGADADWGNVGAFWLTFQGFNHSPTINYDGGSYPDWDVRVDDIVLGAPVPVPGAVWLFSAALAALVSARRKSSI